MKNEKTKKIFKEALPYVIVIIVVALIRTFLVTPAKVDGASMVPTLQNNNLLLLNKINYRINDIERFDIVVLKHNNEKLIKRVIGLPGEHVEYKDNVLYIDGVLIEEKFDHKQTTDFKLEMLGYLTIPGDKYFVVGDNRSNSIDSRTIGLIDKKDILGNTNIRIFPFNKIGRIQ